MHRRTDRRARFAVTPLFIPNEPGIRPGSLPAP